MFAPADDIERYLVSVVERYGLRKYMRFNTAVSSAAFDDKSCMYTISATDLSEAKNPKPLSLRAKFLISCTGQLNVPKLPRYAQDFISQNPTVVSSKSTSPHLPIVMHSAEFDRSVSLSGKTIAIVGNGSTGVQLVEALQPVAGRLLLFQRSPKWVLAKPFLRLPRLVLGLLQSLPFNFGNRLMRYACFAAIELLHVIVSKVGFVQRLFEGHLSSGILRANANAREMNCVPDYRPGCSRIIVHAGYPAFLTRPNVTVVNDDIAGLTKEGKIKTKSDGGVESLHGVDVIIFATGFDVTDCGPQFAVTNSAGKTLKETWREAKERWGGTTLFGIVTPTFPNLFIMYGPHTNTILGSITFFSECAAGYISQCISKVMKSGAKKVTVKEERVVAYNRGVAKNFEGRPEMDTCSAWYKGDGKGAGVPITNFPGGMTEYWWKTKRWIWEDFVVE